MPSIVGRAACLTPVIFGRLRASAGQPDRPAWLPDGNASQAPQVTRDFNAGSRPAAGGYRSVPGVLPRDYRGEGHSSGWYPWRGRGSPPGPRLGMRAVLALAAGNDGDCWRRAWTWPPRWPRSEEHTSELQSLA